MKRIPVLVLAVLGALLAAPATADHGGDTWDQTGTILVSNAATRLYGGISELGGACGESLDPDVPHDTWQGLDGYWFELPEEAAGHDATMTASASAVPEDAPAPGNDVDAWFYDAGCTLIRPTQDPNAYHMATPGSTEFGVVPEGAAWVVVDLVTGANATFTFQIHGWPAEVETQA